MSSKRNIVIDGINLFFLFTIRTLVMFRIFRKLVENKENVRIEITATLQSCEIIHLLYCIGTYVVEPELYPTRCVHCKVIQF